MPAASSQPSAVGPLVVLNPGHNGQDASHPEIINRLVPYNLHGGLKACETTGTETNGGYPEHAFNFDVAVRVRTILQAHRVRVALTRSNDDGVGPCVDARAQIGNQPGSVAVVSIHADGAPSGDHGFHVCYASDPPAGAAVDAASRHLSTLLHDSLASGSGLVPATYIGDGDGYFPRSDLGGLELATVPATFLEVGNMRNAGDAALQTSSVGRQRIADAIATAVLTFVGR
jgi:N-acetylmuramoyl-L-alanine amidase